MNLQALILAAGISTRFNTTKTKLSYSLCGQEMIAYPLKLLKTMNIPTTLIVGYQKELVVEIAKKYDPSCNYAEQKEQKGTGHAVLCAQESLTADHILVLNGDVPLLKKEHLEHLIAAHKKKNAVISCIAAYNADPSVTGYGRIITEDDKVTIVEQRDFTGDPQVHCRFNAGIYLIKRSFLLCALQELQLHTNAGEWYITDLIEAASSQDLPIEIIDAPFDEIRGINTLQELWIADHLKKSQLIRHWMEQGVHFANPASVSIDLPVTIGPDSFIGAGVQLRGTTSLGQGVQVDAYSILDNATVHNQVTILSHSVIKDATIHTQAQVGPFAHIHRTSSLGPASVVGNFVEVSKSTIGSHSKAKHLSYLGMAHIGSQVTMAAGSITCNFNGVTKHVTQIEDNAFVGTNVSLIAPITVGKDAMVAAGSVITEDVPAEALAIARERQVNKKDYALHLKKKYND